ncbi:MAG: DUF1553 domain-containing protein [Pirellulaceae bacterium]
MVHGTVAVAAEPTVDFNRDIRSILSNKCFRCHGPDETERQANLRLDQQTSAFSEADSGERAIVPGDPDQSELLVRIRSSDESLRMPPVDAGPSLDQREQDLLERWIREGATFATHWAYQRPQRHAPPSNAALRQLAEQNDLSPTTIASLLEWPAHDMDRFVLQRQLENGLTPSAKADKRTLARRVALDLTGLPPSPAALQRFLKDDSNQAYEDFVDALLNQQAYGEHWARRWLDLARYADSAGYADDPPRTIWAYRDYVIRSLNQNVPFDQFTIEQLAGDLLPEPSQHQLVATAFHRNTQTNNEGGTNDEEYRNVAIVDRVNTTLAVWMGTTMACAQCHTHKYDPISQEDYFRFFAIFNNTADADRRDESPVVDVWTPADQLHKQQLEQRIEDLEKTLQTWTPELRTAQSEWLRSLHQPIIWHSVKEPDIQLNQPHADANATEANDSTTQVVELDVRQLASSQHAITAIRMEWNRDIQLPNPAERQDGSPTNANAYQVRFVPHHQSNGQAARYLRILNPGSNRILSLAEVEVFHQDQNMAADGQASQSSTAYGGSPQRAIDGNTDGNYDANSVTHTDTESDPWWELDLQKARTIDRIVVWNRTDNQLQSRLQNFSIQLLDEERQVVSETTVAESPNPHHTYLVSSERNLPLRSVVVSTSESPRVDWILADALPQQDGIVRFQMVGSNLSSLVSPNDIKLFWTSDPEIQIRSQIPQDIVAAASIQQEERTADQQAQLDQYFLEHAPQQTALRTQVTDLRKELAELKPSTTVPVFQELDEANRRVTRIQLRGNFLALGDEVQPGLPGELFSSQQTYDHMDRMAVAQWIVGPDNPLTARVLVNRYWEAIFGQGIVGTSEEFGSQGDLPTHPKLLDWLATETVRNDWDLKALLKLLVTSATYQQDSRVTSELQDQDISNKWLARGPRFRLSAEMVRDQALAVSGLLSDKMYGPSVRPPQPSLGLNAAFGGGIDWKTSEGEDRYRRAIYTTWRRSNPYPSLTAFDAPNREVCTIRRDRTNTPLQALVTLNDPVYMEAAQALARRVFSAANTPEQRCQLAWETCLCRPPTDAELAALLQLRTNALERIKNEPDTAQQLAGINNDNTMSLDEVAELAALTAVGNVLMNLDEFLMKP